MKITIISFIVCLVLAIPTYGLSLVLFFVVKYFIDQSSQKKIAAAVVSSQDANNSPVIINYVNNAAIRAFFREYGTTATKYKMTSGINKGAFSGYVKIKGNREVVAVIIKNNPSIIITCFAPPMDYGSDMLSLMQKAGFHDEIIDNLIKENKRDGTA